MDSISSYDLCRSPLNTRLPLAKLQRNANPEQEVSPVQADPSPVLSTSAKREGSRHMVFIVLLSVRHRAVCLLWPSGAGSFTVVVVNDIDQARRVIPQND